MTIFQNLQVFHASLCPLGHGGYMKELSKLLSSFNIRCGLYLSADMSSQPMAVYKKVWASYSDLSCFVVGRAWVSIDQVGPCPFI